MVLFTLALGGILWSGGVAGLAALGVGKPGSVAVTHCDSGRGEYVCEGDFTPDDGSVIRRDVHVDGLFEDSKGESFEGRMVTDSRVQVPSVQSIVFPAIGLVVMGALWVVSVRGLVNWVRAHRGGAAGKVGRTVHRPSRDISNGGPSDSA